MFVFAVHVAVLLGSAGTAQARPTGSSAAVAGTNEGLQQVRHWGHHHHDWGHHHHWRPRYHHHHWRHRRRHYHF
ncbi:hypothetical protein F1D61_32605 (plasmid) [Methylobacterium aquaticum]|nr:hypothetical protein F1D61_32605 [Methylobacterium aquaticum]